MNKLTAFGVEMIMTHLDLAIKYKDMPDIVVHEINEVKTRILRASLSDVEVETVAPVALAAE